MGRLPDTSLVGMFEAIMRGLPLVIILIVTAFIAGYIMGARFDYESEDEES